MKYLYKIDLQHFSVRFFWFFSLVFCKQLIFFLPPLLPNFYGEQMNVQEVEAVCGDRRVHESSGVLVYSEGYLNTLLENGTLPARLHAVTQFPAWYFQFCPSVPGIDFNYPKMFSYMINGQRRFTLVFQQPQDPRVYAFWSILYVCWEFYFFKSAAILS